MIGSIAAFLRYADAVFRRTARDVAALPPAAARWRPPAREGEAGWSIGQLVGHIAGARLYFASAYRGEGWLFPELPFRPDERSTWVPHLEATAVAFRRRLEGTPDNWLERRVELIDTPGSIAGWRVLMLMIEHEIAHRAQVDAYAGLEGWPVPPIFGRTFEHVSALQAQERERQARRGGT
jgi:uncharacterized damage-inducible protein DinB